MPEADDDEFDDEPGETEEEKALRETKVLYPILLSLPMRLFWRLPYTSAITSAAFV